MFADFSQSFSVPASDTNNTIFSLYYNPDIDNGYDARLRKDAVIYVNTLDFKRGKIRLDSVQIKNKVAESYRVTFFGDTIKLKDDIGDDKLSDLTWLNNFDHDYDDTTVQTGLTTGIDFTVDSVTYDSAIIYPLISYQRQYLYNSDSSDTTSTDTLVNIAHDAGRTDGVYFGELKPAIKLSVIIDAIEEQYGFNFTGSFFSSSRFSEIYMNLNNSTETISGGTLEFENETGSMSGSQFGIRYECTVSPKVGFESVRYKLKLTFNDNVIYESIDWVTGSLSVDPYYTYFLDPYETKAEIITEEDFEFDATTGLFQVKAGGGYIYNNTYNNQVIDLRTQILNQLPDIKVYDFLTSIIKMFNLVARPDGTNIYIQDLETWYGEGQIYDITPYVDTRTSKVSRGKIYREINYKFEESDQILADEYKQANKDSYGDLEFALTDDSGNPLDDVDGGSLDIQVLFENPIHERLFDLDDDTQTDIQYCLYTDREINSISGNPFLFYGVPTSVSSFPIGFKGVSSYTQLNSNVIMPSHAKTINANSFNLNFNAVVNEYTYEVYQDTIFDRYYSDYITDMFSIRRRLFDFDAILPDSILNKLELNDRLIINDRRYIQNSTSSNLVTRKDTLQLINDIYDAPLASDTLNSSLFNPSTEAFTGDAQSDSTQYVGLSGKTIALVDTGDGTSWVTLDDSTTTSTIFEVTFSLDTNLSGVSRSAQIQVTDGVNDPKYTIIQDNKRNASMNFSNLENSVYPSLLLNIKT